MADEQQDTQEQRQNTGPDGGQESPHSEQGGQGGQQPGQAAPSPGDEQSGGSNEGQGEAPPTFDAKYVQSLRSESAGYRTKARDAEKQAADTRQQFDALKQSLGKALGFVEDEQQDPDDLIRQLTAERDANQAAVRELQTRDAVRTIAAKPELAADASALLDSRAFTDAIKNLDPADNEFASQVEDAIKAAVEAHPKLRAAPVVPERSGGDKKAGTGEPDRQLTREELQNLSSSERLQAFRDGRCDALLSK